MTQKFGGMFLMVFLVALVALRLSISTRRCDGYRST